MREKTVFPQRRSRHCTLRPTKNASCGPCATSPSTASPTQINCTAGMGRLLAAHYGVSAGELPAVLDNHLVRVDVDHPERLSADGLARFDWWGAGHDTAEEGYYVLRA